MKLIVAAAIGVIVALNIIGNALVDAIQAIEDWEIDRER